MSDEDVHDTLSRMGIDPRGFNSAGCRLQLRMNSQRSPTNLDRAWYEMHPDVNSLQHTVWQLEEDNKKLSKENDKLHKLLHDMESDGDALKRAKERIAFLEAELAEARANVRPDMSDQVALEKSKKKAYKDETENLQEQLRNLEAKLAENRANARRDQGRLEAENEQLHKRIAQLAKRKDAMSLEELGLDKSYRFDKRVYRMQPLVQILSAKTQDKGIGFRTEPNPDKRAKKYSAEIVLDTDGSGTVVSGPDGHSYYGCGPSAVCADGKTHKDEDGNLLGPECIVADAMIQGPDGVYVRDTHTKGWVPLVTKLNGEMAVVLQHLGKEEDLKHRFERPDLGLDPDTGIINIADGKSKLNE